MKISRLIYRFRQFWDVVRTPVTLDLAPAKQVLSESQMALFSRLQPSEQAHGLRVLEALKIQGEKNPDLLNNDLLTAALLHDIGKLCHPLRVWERVLIVLGKNYFPKRMKQWGESQPRGWKRPFVVSTQHPSWGAELAREAGTSPLAIRLITQHQDEPHNGMRNPAELKLLSVLQEADNNN